MASNKWLLLLDFLRRSSTNIRIVEKCPRLTRFILGSIVFSSERRNTVDLHFSPGQSMSVGIEWLDQKYDSHFSLGSVTVWGESANAVEGFRRKNSSETHQSSTGLPAPGIPKSINQLTCQCLNNGLRRTRFCCTSLLELTKRKMTKPYASQTFQVGSREKCRERRNMHWHRTENS